MLAGDGGSAERRLLVGQIPERHVALRAGGADRLIVEPGTSFHTVVLRAELGAPIRRGKRNADAARGRADREQDVQSRTAGQHGGILNSWGRDNCDARPRSKRKTMTTQSLRKLSSRIPAKQKAASEAVSPAAQARTSRSASSRRRTVPRNASTTRSTSTPKPTTPRSARNSR